jgi:hypothetical protein
MNSFDVHVLIRMSAEEISRTLFGSSILTKQLGPPPGS